MRLHRQQVTALGGQIARALIEAGDIEAESAREVGLDVESVLNSYLDEEAAVTDKARELVQQRGLPQGEYTRIRRLAAEQRGIKIGDDALDYVLDQLVNMLMHSKNVAEVFASDPDLRLRMRTFLMAGEESEQALEAEIRSKLKHVQEGSRMWEIEYQRMREEIRRRRGG